MTLLPAKLQARENMMPDDVTPQLRQTLLTQEGHELARGLLVLALIGLGFAAALPIAHELGDPKPLWTVKQAYYALGVLVALLAVMLVAFHRRRSSLIHDGLVTKGVVVDVRTRSRYSDYGGEHTAICFLRYVPSELRDLPEDDFFQDSVPHYEARVKVPAEWGSFGADLQAGVLVSVLYDRARPTRCRIVPYKKDKVKSESLEAGRMLGLYRLLADLVLRRYS